MNIDWKSYFHQFSKDHGGDPVIWRNNEEVQGSGILLFPDGWGYSASNVEGPEYPPPADDAKHRALIRLYWTKRKKILQEHYERLRSTIEDLAATQQRFSADLFVPQTEVMEDETGRVIRRTVIAPVDFSAMLDDLVLIRDDITRCKENIANPQVPDSASVSHRNVQGEVHRALSLIDKGARDERELKSGKVP